MQELAMPDLSGAEFTIDEAAFRKVWERVMPDQRLSPVTLRTPEPSIETPPPPKPQPTSVAPDHYIAGLEILMDEVYQWLGRYDRVARRRAGKIATTLRTMAQSEQTQFRKLSAIYYLMTGNRYLPRTNKSELNVGMMELFRLGFLQEMQWQTQYAHMAERLDDPILQESASDLHQRALENGRQLRQMVELCKPL